MKWQNFAREISVSLDKTTATASLILLFLSLCVIVSTPPASGYEISIYSAYSWYFWIFLCGSISLGVVSLIRRTFWPDDQSNWWKISVYTVIFSNLIIILLPVFRGYLLPNGGDLVIHWGYIKDITLNSHFSYENIYPLLHILSAVLSYITGLDLLTVMKILPPVFYILYMMGLYLLARIYGGKTEHSTLVMAFASIPLFLSYNNSFLPTHTVVLFLPIILMLLQKTALSPNKFQYIGILGLLLIAMPFLHPYESIFLVAIFLVYALAIIIYWLLIRKTLHENILHKYPLVMCLVSALLVSSAFILWFYHFNLFERVIRLINDLIVYGFKGQNVLGNISSQIQSANLSSLEFIVLLIKRYGHQIILCLLSLLSISHILWKIFKENMRLNAKEIFFALFFFIFILLYVLNLIGLNFGIGDSPRILNHSLFSAVILIVLVFYAFYKQHPQFGVIKLKIGTYVITAILIICVVIGVFTVHSSPYNLSANTQVTRTQWSCLEWFYQNKTNDQTIYLEEITRRAPSAIFGTESRARESVGAFIIGEKHFGYDISETLGAVYSSLNTYIVISERNRAIYSELWVDTGHYSLNDFKKLKSDPALSRVYYNGELEIWLIHRNP